MAGHRGKVLFPFGDLTKDARQPSARMHRHGGLRDEVTDQRGAVAPGVMAIAAAQKSSGRGAGSRESPTSRSG